jgi:hypothetical protein
MKPWQQGLLMGAAWLVVGFVVGAIIPVDSSLLVILLASVALVAAWNVGAWLLRRHARE